jgi:hypothetical protein
MKMRKVFSFIWQCGTVLGYGLDDIRDSSPCRGWEFYSSQCTDLLWGPPSLYSMGIRSSFLGVKRLGCKADHLPPSSAEVKDVWSYTSTPPICLHGVAVKAQGQLYLYLYLY